MFTKHQQFHYRLTKCPELCLGLFSTSDSERSPSTAPTLSAARPPDSANQDKKAVLIGHVIATQCAAPRVTDQSMDFPPDWQSGVSKSEIRGHQDGGRTIAVHSVAILPEYQGRGLGIVICKAYTQRMETAGIGDRIALLAHDHLVNFYRKSNYQDRGRSEAKFGGGGWNDMASLPTLDRLRSVVVVRSTC